MGNHANPGLESADEEDGGTHQGVKEAAQEVSSKTRPDAEGYRIETQARHNIPLQAGAVHHLLFCFFCLCFGFYRPGVLQITAWVPASRVSNEQRTWGDGMSLPHAGLHTSVMCLPYPSDQ